MCDNFNKLQKLSLKSLGKISTFLKINVRFTNLN